MRAYIFSPKERDIIDFYLQTGRKLNGFHTLVHHMRKYQGPIQQDLKLLGKVIAKLDAP